MNSQRSRSSDAPRKNSPASSKTTPLEDFTEVIMTVLPVGYVWPPALRRKFDRVYRELADISE